MGCYSKANSPEQICLYGDGKILWQSATVPSGGTWSSQAGSVCVEWKFGPRVGQSTCHPENELLGQLGFSSKPAFPSAAEIGGDGWWRYLRFRSIPSDAYIFENLPLKDDFQAMGIWQNGNLLLLVRAKSAWFKRWSAGELLPQMSAEMLRQWQLISGNKCKNQGDFRVEKTSGDEGVRGIYCDTETQRWVLQCRTKSADGATLVSALMTIDGQDGELGDVLGNTEYR